MPRRSSASAAIRCRWSCSRYPLPRSKSCPSSCGFRRNASSRRSVPESALDYIPLSGDATTPHQVLVAALSAGGVTEVRQLCEAVGVEPDRITLRATAAASFVARRLGAGADEVSLVVNRLTDEADLTVLVGEQVVLVRTVRLPDPSEVAGRARALAGEIRRTIAAVRQQIGDRQVSRVILCGIAAEAGGAASLAGDLGLSRRCVRRRGQRAVRTRQAPDCRPKASPGSRP